MKLLRLCCAGMVSASCIVAQDYTFTLDGKAVEPNGIHRAAAGKWSEGDVITVSDHTLVLGKPGAWHFKASGAGERVLMRLADGKEAPVAVKIGVEYDNNGKSRVVNPLAGLAPEARASLRGVDVHADIGELMTALNGVSAAQVALTLSDDCLKKGAKALPPLPDKLAWLQVIERSNSGFEQFNALATLTELRGLRLRLMTVDEFDANLLADMKQLRYLQVHCKRIKEIEALGKLSTLQHLRLMWMDSLETVAWASRLSSLESLNIAGTPVADIGPLAVLPALRDIAAEGSKVERLGDGTGFAALQRLNILACPVREERAAAFRKAHPKCEVLRVYGETLAAALKGATRLRIRSGGTCHREASREQTFADITAPAEIAEVVAHLEFQESAPPFHCMCCGEPTFEFYLGDRLLAMIGFHHGRGMRWAGGSWPGDTQLKQASAVWLCDWLEKHGVKGAGEELRGVARQQAAAERRDALYGEILPPELKDALSEADSAEAAAKLFADKLPDAVTRARIIYSLYGCTKDSWNIAAGWDEFLAGYLLPQIPRADTLRLAADPKLPEAARRGLARWLFEQEKWQGLDKGALAKCLPALAAAGLTSPRPYNRHRTILQLGNIASPEAVALLNQVLNGEFKPETLLKEEADEPGGMVTHHPGTLKLPEDAPDVAHAAALLLRINDKGSAAAVEKALSAMPADLQAKVREAAKPRK